MTLMLAQAVLLVWVVSGACGRGAPALGQSELDDCLRTRQPCRIDRSCSSLLEKIPKLCGPTDNEHCFSTRQRECKETLIRLKSTQELHSSCQCQNPSSRSCQDYYNLLYNHPCLQQQRRYPPNAQAFRYDLEFADQLLLSKQVALSCTSALHTCRKSPLCRRVYDEYRRRCKIRDGRCRMTNAALCYNSYELIKLTPLWTCTCDLPNEQRCQRIQKTIVGNACIGPFPWMPEVAGADEDEEKEVESASTHMSVMSRSTPARVWPSRSTTTTSKAPRTKPAVQPVTTSTSLPEALPVEETEGEVDPVQTEEEVSELPPESEPQVDIFPGPDEEYVLIPHIAASLMYSLYARIRELLIEKHLMVTSPLIATTTSQTPKNVTFEEESETEVTELLKPQVTAISHRTSSTTLRAGGTTRQVKTSLPAQVTVTTQKSRLSSMTTTLTSTVKSILSSSTLAESEMEPISPKEEDYPEYSTLEQEVVTEFPGEMTTVVEEETTTTEIPTTPFGECWKTLQEMRENADFDTALTQFQDSCRWTTENNDTCRAADCLEYEVRMRRWMGESFDQCRNLTCAGDESCFDLDNLLRPGCVGVAEFLDEMESETVTCRDVKRRNLVLTVRRDHYKRIYTSEECSALCTCDANGKVKCDQGPLCTVSRECRGEYATFPAGSPGYRGYQGQCICHMSKMLCIRPANYTVTKGAWLFMAYSEEEENLTSPYTNMTVKKNLVDQLKKLPYRNKKNEMCLFHVEPSDPEYVILNSDTFNIGNYSADTGSSGTLLNDEYCDKFFRWIVSEVIDRKSVRTDPLLSLMKIAEVEWDRRQSVVSRTFFTRPSALIVTFICFIGLFF